ncbi:MAG: ABC transporter ATP-binding protein [Clostridia bacterium]|nr:ABC transporter ATP-binding protein [Clostridia bacterium]
MKNLAKYLKYYKLQVILGPICKLIETLLELSCPILVAKIIDYGIAHADTSFIIKYGIIVIALNIIGFCFAIICQKCASVASVGIASKIREDMYSNINKLSHAEIDNFGTSSLLTRLTNDVSQIEVMVSILIRVMIRCPCLLIGSILLSMSINLKLSLVFLVVIPVLTIILIIFTKKTMPFFKLVRQKLDVVSRITRENLSGVRVVRAFNHQDEEKERFYDANEKLVKTNIAVSQISALLNPLIFLIVDFAIIAILWFGGVEINVGGLTQGELIAFCNYMITLSNALIATSRIYVNLVRTTASAHRINEVLNAKPSVIFNDKRVTINDDDTQPILEFNNVGFSYDRSETDPERMFIKNLTFSLMPNQTLGIIGSTGSGKTTIANLMTRFYDCNSGEILLYGKNIKDFPIKQLRDIVSITQQRSTLFAGSLRENMQIRKNNATDEEIISALKTSQAWDFVKDFPNTLDYKIMAGGKNVSGGQMQRLTIARSLIGSPKLLILDDSASALDFLTDLNLRKALKKDLNCATVLISQRTTTIKNADLIIVLDHGDVVGMGTHKDLLKNCQIYRETYFSQTQREE